MRIMLVHTEQALCVGARVFAPQPRLLFPWISVVPFFFFFFGGVAGEPLFYVVVAVASFGGDWGRTANLMGYPCHWHG